MISRWLAEGLDRAFIEFAIRPTLPNITRNSRFSRLLLAEARAQQPLAETALFAPPSVPQCGFARQTAFTGGRTKLIRCWPAPMIPVETEWFPEVSAGPLVKSLWFLRASPRPLVVLVGGWAPRFGVGAQMMWPTNMLDQAGYDVVVPMAGCRRQATGLFPAEFPGRSPLRNIVELARATATLGQLLLLARDLGHESILVWGTSLGSHALALLATLPAASHGDFYVFEKPLSRLSDPVRLHARGPSDWRAELADRLDRVYHRVSPLDRLPRVNSDKIVVIGGEYDMVTPISTAQSIATHFNAPLRQIKASHVLQFNRWRHVLEIVTRRLG